MSNIAKTGFTIETDDQDCARIHLNGKDLRYFNYDEHGSAFWDVVDMVHEIAEILKVPVTTIPMEDEYP